MTIVAFMPGIRSTSKLIVVEAHCSSHLYSMSKGKLLYTMSSSASLGVWEVALVEDPSTDIARNLTGKLIQ